MIHVSWQEVRALIWEKECEQLNASSRHMF